MGSDPSLERDRVWPFIHLANGVWPLIGLGPERDRVWPLMDPSWGGDGVWPPVKTNLTSDKSADF